MRALIDPRMFDKDIGLARVGGLFDQFHASQRDFAALANGAGERIYLDTRFYRDFKAACHRQAEQLQSQLDELGGLPAWPRVAQALWQHPYHRDYLLRSDFIRHAFTKPHGYAGDKDLMLMICRNAARGATPYAVLKNQVYQELPAAEAVRQRIRSLRRILDGLGEGACVLNLACGPALEVQEFLAGAHCPGVSFDLIDHDIRTTRYTAATIPDRSVRHLIGNAFQIMKGDLRTAMPRRFMWRHCSPQQDFRRGASRALIALKYRIAELPRNHYDLIYSAGLYDYIEEVPGNPARGPAALTRQLFELLRPGGTLVVGNFLEQAAGNPHHMSHRLMMELYADWKLIYRSRAQIEGFLGQLPAGSFRFSHADEHLEPGLSRPSAIGFVKVTKS